MNIDFVNKEVSTKLGVKESKVKLINQFYWRKVYKQLYSYEATPINIDNVCVFYPNKYLVKRAIKNLIKKIRNVQDGNKFVYNSLKQRQYLDNYRNTLRGYLQIRKQSKFTN